MTTIVRAGMADVAHAERTAKRFVRALAANGTTTALVFGAHFPAAQEALFEAAEAAGLRISSGLVVSDRKLRSDLEVTPDVAYSTSRALRDRWHGRGRLRYAVTPRFSVSCSEAMLDACRALLDEAPTALFTSHVNESHGEIDFVHEPVPARPRLRRHLRARRPAARPLRARPQRPPVRRRTRAPRRREDRRRPLPVLERVPRVRDLPDDAPGGGRRPLRDGHRRRRRHRAVDAQGGAGRLPRPDDPRGRPHARTRVPAVARNRRRSGRARLGDVCGDLTVGKEADLVLLRPPAGSTLEAVLEEASDWDATLGAVFTLTREESVVEVRVGGEVVFARE